MNLSLAKNRELDIICLGRAGVDLYANESNTDFSQVTGFKKYVGGSAANIAVAASRLGLKAGFISALSNDMVGDYVRDYLQQENVNIDGIQTSPEGSRTSLALTEMKADNCGVVIYRNDAADFFLTKNDISSHYLASTKILVVTGTALALSPSREATFFAIEQARLHDTRIVLDLDYRAYSWSSLHEAAKTLRQAAELSDVIVGNREEFDVMESDLSLTTVDDEKTARRFLVGTTDILVLKAGNEGSKTYTKDESCIRQGIFPVDVVKPFGSGDSFLGSFLYGLVNQLPLEEGLRLGSAAAAINVSSDSCTEAMPNIAQLTEWIAQRSSQ